MTLSDIQSHDALAWSRKVIGVLKFFTTWVFLLVVFHKYTATKINLVLLVVVVFVVGSYFSFIYPQLYKVNIGNDVYVYHSTMRLLVADILIHAGMLVFIILKYSNYYHVLSSQTYNAILLMLVYLLLFSTHNVYGVAITTLILPIITAMLVYIIVI